MISERAVALVKKFEGCKLKAYRCPAGIPTIAYGRTQGVKMGDRCTQEQADKWLLSDLSATERTINEFVTVKINQNQRDALASFIYNVGSGNFKNSTLCRKLNCGDYHGASAEFMRWIYAGGKALDGLVKRRTAEKALFDEAPKK